MIINGENVNLSSPNNNSSSNIINNTGNNPVGGHQTQTRQYFNQIEFPFVPSQVPANVKKLLEKISNNGSNSNGSSSTGVHYNSSTRYEASGGRIINTSPIDPYTTRTTTTSPAGLQLQSLVRPPPPPYINTNTNSSSNNNYPSSSASSSIRQPPPPYCNNNNNSNNNGLRDKPPPLPPKGSSSTTSTTKDKNNHVKPLPRPPPAPAPAAKSIHQSPIPIRSFNNINLGGSSSNKDNVVDLDTTKKSDGDVDVAEDEQSRTSTSSSPITTSAGPSKASHITYYSSQAYKFFIEQHIENVIKSHQERMHRRLQLEVEMSKVGLSEEAQDQMRRMLSQKESNYIRLMRAKMNPRMFKKIKTIGIGAFGEVSLVRKSDTGLLYAMKTLRKSDVLQRNQVAHVKAERDILAEADNEWVVKLYYSFQDNESLYFVMDFIPGGDLMSLLIKMGIFEEPLAQFMIAELCCAIESVHKMGFIHRDIKPDNVLIDGDGHIKLTDFGLCTGFRWTHNSKYYNNKDQPANMSNVTDQVNNFNDIRPSSYLNHRKNQRNFLQRNGIRNNNQRFLAHSLVGTPNYIAPEVLMRTGYTQLCDWWSLGVILYEMLIGQPPFLAPTPAETQLKVINWRETLKIPFYNTCGLCVTPENVCSQCEEQNISIEARDLILRLCCGHDERLGKTSGANDIKVHPFFQRRPGINFEQGLRKSYGNAPYVPTILHPADTSNFDCIFDEENDNEMNNTVNNPTNEQHGNGTPNPNNENNMEGILDCEKNDANSSVFSDHHGFFEFTFRRFFDDETTKNPNNNSDDKKMRNTFQYYKKLFEMAGNSSSAMASSSPSSSAANNKIEESSSSSSKRNKDKDKPKTAAVYV